MKMKNKPNNYNYYYFSTFNDRFDEMVKNELPRPLRVYRDVFNFLRPASIVNRHDEPI